MGLTLVHDKSEPKVWSSFLFHAKFFVVLQKKKLWKELDRGLIFKSCPVLAALLGNSVPHSTVFFQTPISLSGAASQQGFLSCRG